MRFAKPSRNDLVAITIGFLIGVATSLALSAAGVESLALHFLLGVAGAVVASTVLFTAYYALVHRMERR